MPDIPRERWLRGGISAKLYFYPDEAWLPETRKILEKAGFSARKDGAASLALQKTLVDATLINNLIQ